MFYTILYLAVYNCSTGSWGMDCTEFAPNPSSANLSMGNLSKP